MGLVAGVAEVTVCGATRGEILDFVAVAHCLSVRHEPVVEGWAEPPEGPA